MFNFVQPELTKYIASFLDEYLESVKAIAENQIKIIEILTEIKEVLWRDESENQQ